MMQKLSGNGISMITISRTLIQQKPIMELFMNIRNFSTLTNPILIVEIQMRRVTGINFNSIDYNSELDQILISVRNSDEIWILDHSTSTEEAASHSGGRYGKGGDILYRWGNASAYKAAPLSDQKLWGQHGANWIADELEDGGKILIYNNGNGKPGEDYSQVQILNPPQDSLGFYTNANGLAYGPNELETIYGDLTHERFYSPYLSNAQRLNNGNTLINAGSPGRIFEIDEDRNIVWEYEIPLFGDFPASQGQIVNNNANFRAYKYTPDFIGFNGITIEPGAPIENNPTDCELTNTEHLLAEQTEIEVYNNSR